MRRPVDVDAVSAGRRLRIQRPLQPSWFRVNASAMVGRTEIKQRRGSAMNRIAGRLLFASALAAVGTAALAQTCEGEECTPPPPPPAQVTAACRPGYFKNHVSRWCNVTCPSGLVINQCTDLLSALYST